MRLFLSAIETSWEHSHAAYQAKARSLLTSFFYARRVANTTRQHWLAALGGASLRMADSGAHTFRTKALGHIGEHRGRAGEVDIDLDAFVEEYIAWLLKMQAQRLIDCWIELDVGAMTSERWVQDVRAKMVKAGLGVGLINVWHSNEHDWDYWIHLLEEARQPGRSHYVAIEGHNIVRPELDYRKFLRAAYERNVRVHGFKLTSEDDMRTNPFFSTDSTSWVSPAWHGSKIGMTPTGGVVVRGKSAKVGKNDVMQSGLRRGAKAPERVAALIQSAEAYVKMEQTMTDAWEARGVHWEDPPCRRT